MPLKLVRNVDLPSLRDPASRKADGLESNLRRAFLSSGLPTERVSAEMIWVGVRSKFDMVKINLFWESKMWRRELFAISSF